MLNKHEHRTVKCSCGRIIENCRCSFPGRAIIELEHPACHEAYTGDFDDTRAGERWRERNAARKQATGKINFGRRIEPDDERVSYLKSQGWTHKEYQPHKLTHPDRPGETINLQTTGNWSHDGPDTYKNDPRQRPAYLGAGSNFDDLKAYMSKTPSKKPVEAVEAIDMVRDGYSLQEIASRLLEGSVVSMAAHKMKTEPGDHGVYHRMLSKHGYDFDRFVDVGEMGRAKSYKKGSHTVDLFFNDKDGRNAWVHSGDNNMQQGFSPATLGAHLAKLRKN